MVIVMWSFRVRGISGLHVSFVDVSSISHSSSLEIAPDIGHLSG